ncbi:alpha/beta fold hydrolase BchO [Pseudosulfitobacter koreensis]|uniref:Alpha/beta fold hydrolase n=1 Tax=Pseudosulfitobacter koreensis TaxID=2968472 RepID=A0ABT1YWH5_9RHOB|nr:alpha/beta fold hydrolase BchO [Pseudosulfitobacter koreense]MCR8825234.1 alpha/beta fold hydrolase [Pseudosulfitobacter koreense]
MKWADARATWPLARHSRFVTQKPHRWHLQEVGEGPTLLLIHGAGGATHSWQHLFPLLAAHHRCIAVDLPGQGFTQLGAQHRCGLDPMAEDLLALCHAEAIDPVCIIGHSAGAAIALRLAEMMQPSPPDVVGINAALGTFEGPAGVLFPVLAKTIAMLPLAANLFSATASQQSVERIIKGTGSTLPPQEIALYRRLVASPTHVSATLQMMAQWQLEPLLDRLPRNTARTLLITASGDKAVPPATSQKAAEKMPNATCKSLLGLGHLAHEEDAVAVAALILPFLEGARA